MNWIKKVFTISDKIKKILKKRPTKEDIENSKWISCCGPILKTDLSDNQWVCNKCGRHHKVSSRERFNIFFGKNNYEILKTPIPKDDPLKWVDSKKYIDRLNEARKKTGQDCAVMIAVGKVDDINVTAGAINFNFIGGSIGTAEGEAIIYGIQHAIDNNNPFIIFTTSGGQRMHESPLALMQMTRTTLAINELKNNNLPYIVCFTSDTAGGVTASFGSLGDIAIAETGSNIIFAGKRVIESTVNEKLPDDFQSADFTKKHGFVDMVVDRKDIKKVISNILSILLKKHSEKTNENNLNDVEYDNVNTKEAS